MRGAALVRSLRALAALALFAAMLAGCGVAEPSADNHGYGWSYEDISASGLRLRYDARVTHEVRESLAVFDAAYAETQACLALAAPGPLVVVVPRGSLDAASAEVPPGAHVGGLYYFDTDLVVVTDSLYALRHEFVHYLLDQAGFPVGRNRAHEHPAFATCAGV